MYLIYLDFIQQSVVKMSMVKTSKICNPKKNQNTRLVDDLVHN